jgi:hypothetical protein
MADKRRVKRRRNLTQALSLASLGTEFDEKSSLHSPVSTPESDKLHSVEGEQLDNPSFWGQRDPEECQRQRPSSNERLNERILATSDAEWNTLDSPSSLPPPPPFLLDQSYQGRNPDQFYGIFEP